MQSPSPNRSQKLQAIFYGRFSSDEQSDGDSKRRQTEGARRYAHVNGILIVRDEFDEGLSAFHGEHISRGRLGVLLREIAEGKIPAGTILLLESFDRLSRQAPLAQIELVTKILLAGIVIVTFTDCRRYTYESFNENPHDLFGALGVMTRGNDEARTRSKRGKENWEEKRRRAVHEKLTAHGPLWLQLQSDRKRWKLLPERVRIVQRIYGLACKGFGRYRIATLLNRQRIKSWGRSKWWTKTYVGRILRNRAVLGDFQPGMRKDGYQVPVGQPIKDYYPAIVTSSVFQKANAIRHNRAAQTRVQASVSTINLFRGLIYDGQTSAAMHYHKVIKNPRHSFLFCSAVQAGAAANSWNYLAFEQSVLQHLDQINWAQLVNNEKPGSRKLNEQRRLESTIEKLDRDLKKLLNLIATDDKPPKTLLAEMKQMENQKTALEQQLAEIVQDNGSISQQRQQLLRAREEIQKLVRDGAVDTRKRLHEEIHKLVHRLDLWSDPGTCRELLRLNKVVTSTLGNAGKTQTSNPVLWPCYRITFVNGAVRWVLCRTTRLQRIDASRPNDPFKDSLMLDTWTDKK